MRADRLRDIAIDPTDETEHERLNRQLTEMLQEVRVAMPGVQVLFGFLLAVPFQQRFEGVTQFQRIVYFVTLLFAGGATACMVAPTAYHRITFRLRDKPALITFGNRMVILGLFCLAAAMTGTVLLVTDFLFQSPMPLLTTLVVGGVFAWLWFAVGAIRRARLSEAMRASPPSVSADPPPGQQRAAARPR
jgi:hypothetical protein